jgi:hypothetical protein
VPLAIICPHAKSQYYYAEALRRPNCTFWGIKADLHSMLLRYAMVHTGLRNLRSAACRDDVNLGTGGNDTQCWLLTLCFCEIWAQPNTVRWNLIGKPWWEQISLQVHSQFYEHEMLFVLALKFYCYSAVLHCVRLRIFEIDLNVLGCGCFIIFNVLR